MIELNKTNPLNKRPDNRPIGFVAVYFNVSGYTTMRENFERFLDRFSWMGDRLLVVELAYFSRDFELTGKHSNMIQLRSDSVMWHKENLINVGTEELRRQGFRDVGWLDGDTIIDGDGEQWLSKLEDSMKEFNLVQVFESIDYHFDDQTLNKYGAAAEYMLTGKDARQCYTAGIGWVVKGYIWDQCGWYASDISGSGDRWLFLGALQGMIDFTGIIDFGGKGAMNHLPTFLSWVSSWRKLIDGRISFLSGINSSCEPHGTCEGRQFVGRSETFLKLGLNPGLHIKKNPDGVFQWTREAPAEMKQYALDYFVNRKEDKGI